MPVPEEIRAVKRPPNTVVADSGRKTRNRYAVRERRGVKYIKGGNPQPITGKVIGHIIDGVYTSIDGKKLVPTIPDRAAYGTCALLQSVSADIRSDLLDIYLPNDAFRIIAIAFMKIICPSISILKYLTHYKRTFISILFPGLHLSKNTVCRFLSNLGSDTEKIEGFYQKRIESISEKHHIIIDGTLKQDTSVVNDFSRRSRKTRILRFKEISIVYAYDLELREPICARVYPGNKTDASVFNSFLIRHKITKGIIVADKGFPISMIKDVLARSQDLHFLAPIKKNDCRIESYDMCNFKGVLHGEEGPVAFRKVNVDQKYFLYSFKDPSIEHIEKDKYLNKVDKDPEYTMEKFSAKSNQFGLIVFESDQDLEPKVVLDSYKSRWEIEELFRAFKIDLDLSTCNVQNECSVMGAEFINSVSTILHSRIYRALDAAGLTKNESFRNLIEKLNAVWRRKDAPLDTMPCLYDGYWGDNCTQANKDLMVSLGLCKHPDVEKSERPRGRPRKTTPDAETVKRRPGRPRKVHPEEVNTTPATSDPAPSRVPEELPAAPKRPRGRPRKNTADLEEKPKRPRGRPRKVRDPEDEKPKRPRGRPRKVRDPEDEKPKRPRGRPRKIRDPEVAAQQ